MIDKAQSTDRDAATETDPALEPAVPEAPAVTDTGERPKEIGGRKGPDPTRYGDWEKNGRCIDF